MASIFKDRKSELFTTYQCTIEIRDRILGGVPKDPKIISGWIRSKAGVTDEEEIRQMMLRTLEEMGAPITPDMSYEDLVQASEKVAGMKNASGFKQDSNGLYIEERQVKAMIKEDVNILFAGSRWGQTKKGPRNFTAERVFVNPAHISLGVHEPTGVELLIVQGSGPQGPRQSLAYHEYVEKPRLTFEIISARDERPTADEWAEVWMLAEENGIGAARSQSYGKFDVVQWEKI